MASQPADTKGKLLQAAYELFYRQGFTRVSVDAIAHRAGVTKRTLYYHFDSKDRIVAEVMEVQHLHLLRQYEGWLGPSSGTAPEIVSDLSTRLRQWAEGPEWLGSGFSRIGAELADMRGHPARQAARRHKAAVETWLAERFEEAGARTPDVLARQIMLLIEGAMSLALLHGDAEYLTAAKDASDRLVRETAHR